eukprot:jgi/Mesen1/4146/ME000218S03261
MARLIQRVSPKSYFQAAAEVAVTQQFFENFSGDQVRFLARSFANPGNHLGQQSTGHRWPYGPVALITPFNFPLEIPILQLMGALYMGNKPVLKVDSKVSIVAEQCMRLLHACGMPARDADLIHSDGPTMNALLLQVVVSTFTLFFQMQNWVEAGFVDKLASLAKRRKLADLSVGPVLTVTTRAMQEHVDKLLAIPGARVAFGGRPLTGHSIPEIYGAFEPTAVFVPLKEILRTRENFDLVTTEIFGPFQVLTEYKDSEVPLVLRALEQMKAHLTAAVVSNDAHFLQTLLGHTVNGTTYAGLRARTTGAPQNHWFGPAGDPRGAGIGTPEAIQLVWSCHREIIYDMGPIPAGWTLPAAT